MTALGFRRLLLSLFLLALAAWPAGAQATGSFSGVVVLDNGKPLAGARVLFNKVLNAYRGPLGTFRPLEPALSGGVTTAADGSFRVDGLPEGSYVVCAAGTQANHLRSCDWGQGSTTARVSAGSAGPSLTLNIRTGALLTINVSDPGGQIRMQDPTGINAAQTTVVIGVISKLGYYRAKLAGHSGTSWSYTVAVPVSTPVSLVLDSGLNIVDQSANAVANRTPSVAILAADSSGVSVNLAVN